MAHHSHKGASQALIGSLIVRYFQHAPADGQRTDSAMRTARSFCTSALRRSATSLLPEDRGRRGSMAEGMRPAALQYPDLRPRSPSQAPILTVVFPPRYADSRLPGPSVRTRLIPVSPSGGSPSL